MNPDQPHKSIKFFALPALIGLAACFQMLVHGYSQGHDWIFELVRIVEYHEALSSGEGLPIWGGDLYRGFGSPIFIFYAPLYLACASLLMMFGLTVTAAAITVLALFSMTAAIGMAGLMWEILGRDKPGVESAARIASVAFVLMPYFLADMLIRNASAEFTALCLSPFPFWGLALIRRGNPLGLGLLAISFALVITAHNLTSLVVAACLLAVVPFVFPPQRRTRRFLSSTLAMLLSLGLSCWFWLPALWLKPQIRIHELLQGKFDFHNNFSPVTELFAYDGLFAIGWFLPAIFIVGIAALVQDKKNPLLRGLMVMALAFVFLQTSPSTPAWEAIPLLPLFQFPWRMMGPLSFIAALLAGWLYHRYLAHLRFAEFVLMAIIVVNAIPLLQQFEPLSNDQDQFVSAVINPRGIRQHGLSATVLDEYLPHAANKGLSDRAPLGAVVIPSGEAIDYLTPARISQTRVHLEIETGEQIRIHIARWYFPAWHATLDDADHPVSADSNGAILLEIPAGRHQVSLYLSQPTERIWGLVISTISGILVLLMILTHGRRLVSCNSPEQHREKL